MTGLYRSRMGRAALEDGPFVPDLWLCPDCRGDGTEPASTFGPADTRDCRTCEGTGEVTADQVDEDQR